MAQKFESLLSSELLSEEAKTAISEAWQHELTEARDEITAELREEFASRYDNDKEQIVEAMDSMLRDVITKELTEFADDKRKLHEDRVAYKKAIREHTKKLDKFINEALQKEVLELLEDRKSQQKNFGKLEEFVITKLTEEINEFYIDKKALVEQRIRLTREGKRAIKESKQKFIKEAAAKVDAMLTKSLTSEINTLKEDIKTAKENNFGRKIFETFAAEFMTSALSEGTEIAKLNKRLTEAKSLINKKERIITERDTRLVESNRKIKIIQERGVRSAKLAGMLGPLGNSQRSVMASLLESVSTDKLDKAFDKYLPTVLAEGKNVTNITNPRRAKLTENTKVVTGNKATRTQSETEGSAEILRIKRLAGIQS